MDPASILLVAATVGVTLNSGDAPPAPGESKAAAYSAPDLAAEAATWTDAAEWLTWAGLAERSNQLPGTQPEAQPATGTPKPELIVRGQNALDEPLQNGSRSHVAAFAGESGWTSDRYSSGAPAVAQAPFDRYQGARPSTSPVQGGASIVGRAENAASATGNTLRDGVEAGIQAANQQLGQVGGQFLDGTRNVGQGFGEQLQDITLSAGRQLQTTASNLRNATEQTFGTAGAPFQQLGQAVGLGGTATQSTAIARTDSGWTSIGSTVAAPPLINPPLVGRVQPTTQFSPTQFTGVGNSRNGGPQFPFGASAAPSVNAPATGFGTNPGVLPIDNNRLNPGPFSNTGLGGSGLVPVQPLSSAPGQPPQQSPQTGGAPGQADVWSLPPQSLPPATPGQGVAGNQAAVNPAESWAANAGSPTSAAGQGWGGPTGNPGGFSHTAGPHAAGQPAYQWSSETGAANVPPAHSNAGGAAAGPAAPPSAVASDPRTTAPATSVAAPTPAGEAVPWMPLVVAMLALVGSVGANVFLGWSYMDARQKYRALVRKTAQSFRRVADAAA